MGKEERSDAAAVCVERRVIQVSRAKYCCAEIESKLIDGQVLSYNDTELYIYGRPRFVDDGDGRHDDMTEEIKIRFCPFCGTSVYD